MHVHTCVYSIHACTCVSLKSLIVDSFNLWVEFDGLSIQRNRNMVWWKMFWTQETWSIPSRLRYSTPCSGEYPSPWRVLFSEMNINRRPTARSLNTPCLCSCAAAVKWAFSASVRASLRILEKRVPELVNSSWPRLAQNLPKLLVVHSQNLPTKNGPKLPHSYNPCTGCAGKTSGSVNKHATLQHTLFEAGSDHMCLQMGTWTHTCQGSLQTWWDGATLNQNKGTPEENDMCEHIQTTIMETT